MFDDRAARRGGSVAVVLVDIDADAPRADPRRGNDAIDAAERVEHERPFPTAGESQAAFGKCDRKRGRMISAVRAMMDRFMRNEPAVTSAVQAAAIPMPPVVPPACMRHSDRGTSQRRAAIAREMKDLLPDAVEVAGAGHGAVMASGAAVHCQRLYPCDLVLKLKLLGGSLGQFVGRPRMPGHVAGYQEQRPCRLEDPSQFSEHLVEPPQKLISRTAVVVGAIPDTDVVGRARANGIDRCVVEQRSHQAEAVATPDSDPPPPRHWPRRGRRHLREALAHYDREPPIRVGLPQFERPGADARRIPRELRSLAERQLAEPHRCQEILARQPEPLRRLDVGGVCARSAGRDLARLAPAGRDRRTGDGLPPPTTT